MRRTYSSGFKALKLKFALYDQVKEKLLNLGRFIHASNLHEHYYSSGLQ